MPTFTIARRGEDFLLSPGINSEDPDRVYVYLDEKELSEFREKKTRIDINNFLCLRVKEYYKRKIEELTKTNI